MVKPLSFKGDKKPRKRKRPAADGNEDGAPAAKELATAGGSAAQAAEDDDSWVTAEAASDISGPVTFVLPTDPPAFLGCDANGTVFTSKVENMVEDDPSTAEPHDVRQVWIAHRVAGNENFSFKGHHGKYLACDKFGVLSAQREAVSQDESFLCIPVANNPGTFAVQNLREKFIAVDEGKNEVRGDSENIDFNSTFRIRMQARFKPRPKTNKEQRAAEKISRKELEEMVGRPLEDDEVKKLKRSRRAGNFHETLLDVKVKGKHDKFA
ncbi:frg1-like family protein [Diplodia corticola]|uniref:Frg1-like family protein n=1 Tax=Diplodia corticola TaxID=236234 RepID=A0A1J9RP78_9PEZI|nr:frg1-like family protein [Diplodia corticola]OJD34355.1 frg1-like family protein [Diplodia corticola]